VREAKIVGGTMKTLASAQIGINLPPKQIFARK
jgi:hypothetical protein